MSFEPFKFWWAPTISLERLIVSGAVNLSPVHTSDIVAETGDIVAKSRDIVAKNGNNIEATLSKQLLVFNPVAMPPLPGAWPASTLARRRTGLVGLC